jgi:CHAT domain-containing protein
VIASAWALHDEAAARAFGVFYDCLSEGKGVREALHQARRRVREWREHPYYWGALTLYRGYGI